MHRKHPATFGSIITRPAGMRGIDCYRLVAAPAAPDASSEHCAAFLPRIALLMGCTHGRQAVSHLCCASCRLRPAGLPPGTPLQMTCCVVCDQQLRALVSDVGASRPPGQAGNIGATGKSWAGMLMLWESYSQQHISLLLLFTSTACT